MTEDNNKEFKERKGKTGYKGTKGVLFVTKLIHWFIISDYMSTSTR